MVLNTIKSYIGVFLLDLINAIKSPEVIYQLSPVPAKDVLECAVAEGAEFPLDLLVAYNFPGVVSVSNWGLSSALLNYCKAVLITGHRQTA